MASTQSIFTFIATVILLTSCRSKSENLDLSNTNYVFGIDVSQYQGKINWKEVKNTHHPIKFVFIRATMGKNGIDSEFSRNWENAKKHDYIRGAYHYYRPNENSTKQFQNFSSIVDLEEGDFRPILDIEKPSKFGKEKLRTGIQNWLKLAENKYSIKPVIYTGRAFYHSHLKGYFDDYPLWIASYSGEHKMKNVNWTLHQFTENVRVNGIKGYVDGNNFNGELEDLKQMCYRL